MGVLAKAKRCLVRKTGSNIRGTRKAIQKSRESQARQIRRYQVTKKIKPKITHTVF